MSSPAAGQDTASNADNKREQRDRSYQIDKQIEEDSKKYRKECKILLLGSGESGKSTVVKQMKIIHQNGYSKDELVLCRATIYKNVMDSAQALVMALRKFKMDPVEPVNRVYADNIMDYRLESSQTLASEIVRAVESLGTIPSFRRCWIGGASSTSWIRHHISSTRLREWEGQIMCQMRQTCCMLEQRQRVSAKQSSGAGN